MNDSIPFVALSPCLRAGSAAAVAQHGGSRIYLQNPDAAFSSVSAAASATGHTASAVCAGSTTGITFGEVDAGHDPALSPLWRVAVHEGAGHVFCSRYLDLEVAGTTELLKPLGYATAQIGKNHLGDRNEYLPTVHGFDEFYGILYHLNAMEEPYEFDYPKQPGFRANFGPRNIVDTKATTVDDPTIDPRWGRVGKQTIVDGGPLPPHPNMDPNAKTNMEDVDDELVRRSLDFMDRSVKANKPFFLWHNPTRTHVWTHLSPKWQDKSGFGLYADAMMELDAEVGSILKKIDDLGIADNTIVVFTSDNGSETFTWPDGGNSPFRGEKGTTFEGGFRVPMLMKWPGTIKPGRIVNDITAGEDFLPTFVAAAGDPDITSKLLNGLKVGDKTFKTHLDGYNFLPFLKGDVAEGPRKEFFYFTDGGDLNALRYGQWKISFKTVKGNLFTGTEESTNVPIVTNLRQDPWERYQDQSMAYGKWWGEKLWTMVPAVTIVGGFLKTFKEYPPSQVSGTLTVDKAVAIISRGAAGKD